MENIKIYKALFIVYTPFQGICAINAIKQLGIDDYVFAIYKDFNSRQKQLETLLIKSGIKYIYIEPLNVKSFLRELIKRHNHYDAVFIGDYYNGMTGYMQAAISLGFHSKLFYLDDGNSTIEVFSEHPRSRYSGIINRLLYGMYNLVMKCKFTSRPYFFTMFDVTSNKFHIIKNEMFFLKESAYNNRTGIYVIGTNATSLKLPDYHQLLQGLYEYIKDKWLTEIVYYCPHKGDPANDSHIEFCQRLGMELFDTQISVECDFAYKKINPLVIMGFGSTALVSLHKMFPDTTINNILFELNDPELKKAYWDLQMYFEGLGIKSIKMY